jgi:nitroreductase
MKNLDHIIANRRTVKPERYTGELVPEEAVLSILNSANWAPTHGNTEPWRFVVFAKDSKTELLQFLNELDEKLNGFNEVRNQKRKSSFDVTSHIIAIGMKRGDNPKIPELEELLAVGMAVQNMWLTTHDLGFGGYWSTGALAYRDELRDFLGLESADRSLGFFYLGTPIAGLPEGKRLTAIQEKVTWR